MIFLQLFGGIVALCCASSIVAYVGFGIYWRLNPPPAKEAPIPLSAHEIYLSQWKPTPCCAPRRDGILSAPVSHTQAAGQVAAAMIDFQAQHQQWQPAEYADVIRAIEPVAPPQSQDGYYWDIHALERVSNG